MVSLSEKEMRKIAEDYLAKKKINGQVLSVSETFEQENPNLIQIKVTYRGSVEGSNLIETKQETLNVPNKIIEKFSK